ncbi:MULTISPECIES: RelA/SpoT domain-containing protein [Hyphomonadaceae]|jgi:ppGpp synthetase/RelA/SpoT-type nucleotidyltranferase|uniref:RelA/SpoT domain-containing protein n=1 Tax=Hyphomonadaceae TaxID=69657 RepID=UPI0009FD11D9|nr:MULTISPECIES: RelA/SpoT domain-containing protein [Hyphomonadaceae]
MNIDEYESSGRALYAELCDVVAELLDRAIQNAQGFRLQQIQSRAKDPISLRARLKQAGAIESEEIETVRKDLAGCRIVFYTNNDVNRFATSGLLGDLFEIDWDRSKFHQPGPGAEDAEKLFQSYNYVVRLKDDRTTLVEYDRFKGLWCEVQVQTTLNHAWAEMAHDIIYKRPEIKGFGDRDFAMIERRLGEVMRNHLLPAGYVFQKIASDVQRLMEGKALFDLGAVDAILSAPDNNERKDAAERLRDDILPYYDDPQTEFPDIREKLKQAWLAAHDTATKSRETPFGNYPGAEPHDVAKVIADILERYRYLDPEATYAAIRDLFVQTNNPDSRKHLIGLAEKLSAHTLQVWEKYGPIAQTRLANALKAEENLDAMAPIAATICGEILKPDITGTSSSSNTVTFHTGAIIYSDALAAARRNALDVLILLAVAAPSEDDQRLAISNLFIAGSGPQHGAYSNDVMAMILDDSAHLLHALQPILTQKPMDVRQDYEQRILHLWRRYRSLSDDLMRDAKVAKARTQLIDTIFALRDALNVDEEFVIFKTLVGFRSVFPHMWEDNGFDFRKDQRIRDQRQDELLDSISEETWGNWKQRLGRAAAVQSNDLATFPPLVRFFEQIARRHPTFGMNLLNDRDLLPYWTLAPLAVALLETDARVDAKAALLAWAEKGEFLPEIASTARFTKTVDRELVLRVVEISRDKTDQHACVMLLEAATRRFVDDKAFWRDKVFFPCLSTLHAAGNHRWIDYTWFSAQGDSLFADLSAAQRAALLDAMADAPTIDYHAEAILLPLARQDHIAVLEYFGRRIASAEEEGRELFDAVPFSFHEVNKALQSHPKDVLNALRRWNDADGVNARWQLSHFLSRVYPEFESPLPETLTALINGADGDTLAFVISLLEGFEGRETLLPILRAILASDAATDDIEKTVSLVFQETGMMTGEFGAAETYQAKADSIRSWLDDASGRVRAFAEKEIRSLERRVAAENRRAQEEIALRRLDYGEPLTDADE